MAAAPGEPGPVESAGSDALREARARRVALGEAMTHTELALALPGGHPAWRDEVAAALDAVRRALDDHVAEVEGERGLLAELSQLAPRLSPAIDHLVREHPDLCDAVDAARRAVGGDPVADVRIRVLDLLHAISRHRQRGADLVYEAYNVDIGEQ